MLGWIGNVFIVFGLWGVGNKNRRAFLYCIVGEAAWTANAVLKHDWALASICVVFLGMAIRGYVKWA